MKHRVSSLNQAQEWVCLGRVCDIGKTFMNWKYRKRRIMSASTLSLDERLVIVFLLLFSLYENP